MGKLVLLFYFYFAVNSGNVYPPSSVTVTELPMTQPTPSTSQASNQETVFGTANNVTETPSKYSLIGP